MDHCTRRMRSAGMEVFILTIGEGYGMENAVMLIICQDPDNPRVKRSGELSFTNDDSSANMLRESFKYLDLDWGITVPWNAILWTQMGEKDHDLDLVGDWHIIPKWGFSRPELIYWLREELEAAKEYAEEDLQGGEQ